MDKINFLLSSKKLLYFVFVCIFCAMLLLNFLTYFTADDYIYMNSFMTGEPLGSFFDIFPSLYRHYFVMNGRLTAHFFAQVFLMMPKVVFNVVNSLMFLAMLLLLDKSSNRDGKTNFLIFGAYFCTIWIFQPAFGQVNLWLDGSVNYLWSAAAALCYLLVFVNRYEGRKVLDSAAKKALFVILSFFVGNYSENTSSAVIAVSFFIMLVLFIKKRPFADLLAGWVVACAGFLFMALSPAGIRYKVNSFSFSALIARFYDTIKNISSLKWLIALWAALFIIGLVLKVKKERLFISLAYMIAGLFANFILVFSTYYPPRSMCSVTVFVVAALFTLVWELYENSGVYIISCAAAILVLASVPVGYIGAKDVYHTYILTKQAVNYIEQCRDEGIMDVAVPYIYGDTKYSAVNGLKYLDTEDPDTWPNRNIARYYKINSIIAYK